MAVRKHAMRVLLCLCCWLIFCCIAEAESDQPPSLTITSEIPRETENETLFIEGLVSDDRGIVNASVRVISSREAPFVSALQKTQGDQKNFTFHQNIPLNPGENTIILQVVDTDWQAVRKVAKVVRNSSGASEASQKKIPSPSPIIPSPIIPSPTPKPQSVISLSPTPTPSKIEQLLQLADRYFDKQWFLTPKESNAFDAYAEVLGLEPSNRHARERLQSMLRKYYNWGMNNFTKGDYEKTQTYYQRYLKIAEFLVETLNDEELGREVQTVKTKLEELTVLQVALKSPPSPLPLPPTPTPLVEVSPKPSATAKAEIDQPPPPSPKPTAPAELSPNPSAPVNVENDQPPLITLTSSIPAEMSEETLSISGIVTDDTGVTEVTVSLQTDGTKGLAIAMVPEEEPEQTESFSFEKVIRLAPGTNRVLIEAYNTKGQVSQEEFQVVRRQIETPSPSISAAVDVDSLRPGDVYAVIIGIGTYADERLNLRYTVNDAQGLYDLLTHPDYGGVPEDHIQLLLDEDATDRGIKAAIGKWLSRQANEEDTVLIYYSGHGAPEGDETYWVTYNADIDDLYTTALDNNEIADMLSRVRSKRVLTFLDSCYSAATVNRKDRTRSAPTEIPWEKFGGEGRVTISASDGKQLSLELEEYGHGVFTYYLLEGLKGQADANEDGVVELDEIWDYVKFQVRETAQRAGNSQTPVFQGSHSAGIPLTFNMAHFRSLAQQQTLEAQQQKLAELHTQGKIEDAHFTCALEMLDAGTSNVWLDKLLADKITPDIFNRFFSCD